MKLASSMDPAVGGLSGGSLGALGPILYGMMTGEPGRGARAGGRALLEGTAGGVAGLAAGATIGRATGANALSQVLLNRGLTGLGASVGSAHGAYKSLKNTSGKVKKDKAEKETKKKASLCLFFADRMVKVADDEMGRNMMAIGRSGVESHVGMLAGLAGLPIDLHRNADPATIANLPSEFRVKQTPEDIAKMTQEIGKSPFGERALLGTIGKGMAPLTEMMNQHGDKVEPIMEAALKADPKLTRLAARELAEKQVTKPGLGKAIWALTKGHVKATPVSLGLAGVGGLVGGIHGWRASKRNSRPLHEKATDFVLRR